MVYLSSFALSTEEMKNPNIYPYCVFENKGYDPLVFTPITILYGDNGCGKSSLLNIIAQKIGAKGFETYAYGQRYIQKFVDECRFDTGTDDFGHRIGIPARSLYLKSEDVLYEIKKIQQRDILERDLLYKQGKGLKLKSTLQATLENIQFAQEKYSNGETAMKMIIDILEPDSLYLLDEPEVSLSPQNQVRLAEEMNHCAHFLGCQFIIATHSPFMLGTLQAKIYYLNSDEIEEKKWYELKNVRYFYEFFEKNKKYFNGDVMK